MGFRSNCGSLLAELRGLSRSLWTYALTAAVVIAPFFIGVQKEKLALTVAASVAFVLALCVLGLATRLGFVVACLGLAISALVHQHVTRRWGGGQLDARIEAMLESPPGEMRQYLESHMDAVDVLFVIGACLFAIALLVAAWRANAPSWRLRLLAMLAVVAGTPRTSHAALSARRTAPRATTRS